MYVNVLHQSFKFLKVTNHGLTIYILVLVNTIGGKVYKESKQVFNAAAQKRFAKIERSGRIRTERLGGGHPDARHIDRQILPANLALKNLQFFFLAVRILIRVCATSLKFYELNY